MRATTLAAVLAWSFAAAGCGQKGPLLLPPPATAASVGPLR
ncbi:MAG: LPS translocon maturation chaperone LptM [Aquabacterium sp.]